MLSTTVRDAYYTPIEGISNTVTWHLNDPYLASLIIIAPQDQACLCMVIYVWL